MSVRSLTCPSCGAAITLRALAWTRNVACESCGAVLDARDPNLAVLDSFGKAVRVSPAIPLGTRGQWRGAPYEVIGFQVRKIVVDDVPYFWREYLLFNPYHGFRYLTEYDGHWNDVVALRVVPTDTSQGGDRGVMADGRFYRHFQSARAVTSYVLGEFPWEVRAGDAVASRDYVAPPFLLSAEESKDEVAWSLGEYVAGAEVWRAFKVPGTPPPARGVFANQPSPWASAASMWRSFGALALAAALLMLLRLVTADNRDVHRGNYLFHRPDTAATIFVTPSFDLAGGPANVRIDTDTDLDNSWVFLDFALINESTGAAYDFGREVSYYHGIDSGERWSEGSRHDAVRIANVPDGRYFLRVEEEGPAADLRIVAGTLRVRRDVPSVLPFLLALVALVIPPGFLALQHRAFETARWAESDHAPVGASDESEDE